MSPDDRDRGLLAPLIRGGRQPERIDATPSNQSRPFGVPLPPGRFVNPIGEGADPSVAHDGDRYLWCQSEGNVGVAVWASDRLTSLGTKHVVWRAPPDGPFSQQVWAPELFKLDGHWYIYVAASDGEDANHRAYVLVADSDDPLGTYTLHGPLYTGDDADNGAENIWAIDMTVFEHAGRRYAVWSGWPDAETRVQHLYIAPMTSPVTLGGPRIRLCAPDDYDWERVDEQPGSRGLNEGPQVMSQDGRTFVIYSCSASWLPSYKVGMLELTGDDPLDPAAWAKGREPVFRSSERTFGVGHGQVVASLDRSEWWHVYHTKRDRSPGWQRRIFIQRITWPRHGAPDFGVAVTAGQPLDAPSGTPAPTRRDARSWHFTANPDCLRDFDYYGHHQFVEPRDDGLHIGIRPVVPVNAFRTAEKVVVRDAAYDDLLVSTVFSVAEGDRTVGVLFRATGVALGVDTARSYLAGVVPRRDSLVLGIMNGRRWQLLAEVSRPIDVTRPHLLAVRAVGDLIEVTLDDEDTPAITCEDSTYPAGTVGLRVLNTHARFTQLDVRPARR